VGSKIPGAQLYLTNSEYSGERELKPYPVPPNIHGMIEGRKSASFNPWKVRCDRARPPPLVPLAPYPSSRNPRPEPWPERGGARGSDGATGRWPRHAARVVRAGAEQRCVPSLSLT